VLPSSGDSFPHLIQKRGSQLGFVTHLLTYLRTMDFEEIESGMDSSGLDWEQVAGRCE